MFDSSKIWGFILPEISDIEGEIDLWTTEIEKNFQVIRATSYEEIIAPYAWLTRIVPPVVRAKTRLSVDHIVVVALPTALMLSRESLPIKIRSISICS